MGNAPFLLLFLCFFFFSINLLPSTLAIWLTLPASGTKCVSEEIQNNVVVLADYVVVPDDHTRNPTLAVKVTSPYGNNLHHKENTTHGSFAFTTQETGNYLACFWVDGGNHGGGEVSVNLDWKIGIAAKDWDSVAKKEKIEGVELELRKLEGAVEAIHENLLYLKGREAEMRTVSERTNGRVAWFSIMSLGICIGVSFLPFVAVRMSSKSDTTALDEPKWDWSKPKGMKPRPPPLPTWMIPKGPSMPILEEDRDLIIRECYKGVEDYIYQSPYDPTPLELIPKFFGGSPTVLLDITDDQYRSIVNKLSRLALEYYNKLMRTSFEFHDLVKCTYWSDNRRQAIFNDHYRRDPSRYCITFQAKEAAKGDTSSSSSSSPAITIFRATVLVDRDDKDKPPVVEECFIHSPV